MGLFLTLSSCNWSSDCNKIEISKEWIDVYSVGDTIVLKSNLNNYDTLLVKTKDSSYSPCNKFELGSNQFQSMSMTLESMFNTELDKCKKQMKKERIILTLGARRVANNEFIGVNVYNLHFTNSTCEYENNDSPVNCENLIKLRTSYFEDTILTYKFDKRNTQFFNGYINTEYHCAIKSFHWSKEHGLVQYETEENEVYSLIKK